MSLEGCSDKVSVTIKFMPVILSIAQRLSKAWIELRRLCFFLSFSRCLKVKTIDLVSEIIRKCLKICIVHAIARSTSRHALVCAISTNIISIMRIAYKRCSLKGSMKPMCRN